MVWIEIAYLPLRFLRLASPPARVVWIEMWREICALQYRPASPPARVVWIEIYTGSTATPPFQVATREGGVD